MVTTNRRAKGGFFFLASPRLLSVICRTTVMQYLGTVFSSSRFGKISHDLALDTLAYRADNIPGSVPS